MSTYAADDFDDLGEIQLPSTTPASTTPHPIADFNDNPLHQLSNSTLGLKHTCARKFQIDKLTKPDRVKHAYLEFGTVLGIGIQLCVAGVDEPHIVFEMMKAWKLDLTDGSRAKQRQTFFHAVYAMQVFNARIMPGLIGNDWELAEFDVNGERKLAIELGFRIELPDGFYYRGYIDLILRNKKTGEIMVVELKTTSMRYLNESHWKNSGQALGYSIVLDKIAPDVASYKLLFIVYQTHNSEFTPFPFMKQSSQRARWLQDVITECADITSWESRQSFPMYGENCLKFNSVCPHFDTCEFQDRALFSDAKVQEISAVIRNERYDFEFSFEDIIGGQLDRLDIGVNAL